MRHVVQRGGRGATTPPGAGDARSQRYDLAVFDFDGTLADSLAWFWSRYDEAARRFGLRRLDRDAFERLRGADTRTILRETGTPLWKVAAIARFMREAAAREVDAIDLFPGVEPMIGRLAAGGVRLAIATSNTEENVRRVLGPALAARFEAFSCGSSLFGKGARLRALLRRLAVDPARAIYIGDEIRDAEAARSVGMAFGAVSWGYQRREALEATGPDELFDAVASIADRIVGPG